MLSLTTLAASMKLSAPCLVDVIEPAPIIYLPILAIPSIQWLLTLTMFVPLHARLGKASSEQRLELIQRLVHRNWLRTSLWTIELAALLYLLSII